MRKLLLALLLAIQAPLAFGQSTCESKLEDTALRLMQRVEKYCWATETKQLDFSNPPARHMHRAVSLVAPSSSFIKKVYSRKDENQSGLTSAFKRLFEDDFGKWEVHSYIFWAEALGILAVAWVLAILCYYIPVLISRKCCCALNYKRDRTPLLGGVIIPGSILGLMTLFFIAVMIPHVFWFHMGPKQLQCIATESLYESLYGWNENSHLPQLSNFEGAACISEEFGRKIGDVNQAIENAKEQFPGLNIDPIDEDSTKVIDEFIETAKGQIDEIVDAAAQLDEWETGIEVIFIVLNVIYAVCLLNVALVVWLFVHYYLRDEYQNPIKRPGGFHTRWAGFLIVWIGVSGALLLFIAGGMWAILYFTSDGCRFAEVELLKHGRWSHYEAFEVNGDPYIPEELTQNCIDPGRSGSMYEAFQLTEVIAEIEDVAKELESQELGQAILNAIPADPDCSGLRDLIERPTRSMCDVTFGSLGLISWCIFFLSIMHFIAWIYIQRFWRGRRGLMDLEKQAKDLIAASDPDTAAHTPGERISDDQFLAAAQVGDLEKVQKALDQRYHPNTCFDVLYNNSPLHLAAFYGHLPVVELLLDHKYDPNAINFHQYTPFSACANNREIEFEIQAPVLRALAKHGAKIDTFDHQGDTPLLRAVRAKNEALVTLLLELGADPEVRDQMLGESSLQLANTYREESPNLVRILSSK